MKYDINRHLRIATDVRDAIENKRPIAVLESTVITHGLPYPENLKIAQEMEAQVAASGATAVTIAVIDGVIKIGLSGDELEGLSTAKDTHKISRRDYGPAIAKKWSGGTTVAGTMMAADLVGLKIFATGGIGGVHRVVGKEVNSISHDVSADLPALANIPMIVVCAGAKAILDLPATLEYLETSSIPVVGYRTHEFPAFYSRSSGLGTSSSAENAGEIVRIAESHWSLGLESAVLVVNPLPESESQEPNKMDAAIEEAIVEIQQQGISGQDVTPFLLRRVSEITGGESLKSNLALLRNNAGLAGEIAVAYYSKG